MNAFHIKYNDNITENIFDRIIQKLNLTYTFKQHMSSGPLSYNFFKQNGFIVYDKRVYSGTNYWIDNNSQSTPYISISDYLKTEPKYKVGDIVNTNSNGFECCITNANDFPNGSIVSTARNNQKITSRQYSDVNYNWWYKFDNYGNWFTEDAIEGLSNHNSILAQEMSNMQKAQRDYPKGTKYFPLGYLSSDKDYFSTGVFTQIDNDISCGYGYVYYRGEWAKKIDTVRRAPKVGDWITVISDNIYPNTNGKTYQITKVINSGDLISISTPMCNSRTLFLYPRIDIIEECRFATDDEIMNATGTTSIIGTFVGIYSERKIRVYNEETNKLVQEHLFKLGYSWNGDKSFKYLHATCLYLSKDMKLSYTSGDDMSYFNNHMYKELYLSDLGIIKPDPKPSLSETPVSTDFVFENIVPVPQKHWMEGTKIKIPNEEIGKQVQLKAFEMGYKWGGGATSLYKLNAKYLYFDIGRIISYTNDSVFFEESPEREITLENLGINRGYAIWQNSSMNNLWNNGAGYAMSVDTCITDLKNITPVESTKKEVKTTKKQRFYF